MRAVIGQELAVHHRFPAHTQTHQLQLDN